MKGLFVVCIAIISMFSVHFLNHYLDLIWQNIDFAEKNMLFILEFTFPFVWNVILTGFFYFLLLLVLPSSCVVLCVKYFGSIFNKKVEGKNCVLRKMNSWLGILTKKRRKKKADWLTHISMYLITYNIFQLTFLCEHFLF